LVVGGHRYLSRRVVFHHSTVYIRLMFMCVFCSIGPMVDRPTDVE